MPYKIAMSEVHDQGHFYHAQISGHSSQTSLFYSLIGRVNHAAFAGHPSGTLMVVDLKTFLQVDHAYDIPGGEIEIGSEFQLTFQRNESRPWNSLPSPTGGLRELLGPDGKPAFPLADFAVLDGHPGMIDLVRGEEWSNIFHVPWEVKSHEGFVARSLDTCRDEIRAILTRPEDLERGEG